MHIERMELLEKWREFTKHKIPHASIRIGDGEGLVLAHETILTMDFIRKIIFWINNPVYCGVTLPNPQARNALVDAIKKADFVGLLHETSMWNFKPVFDMARDYYQFNLQNTFYAFDNYWLAKTKEFYDTFKYTKVLLIGNKAKEWRSVLERRYHWKGIVGTVACPNWYHLEQAKTQILTYNFDLALLSAGIPAKILSVYIKGLGKVAVDFGSGSLVAIQADADGLNAWEWDKFPKYDWH